MLGGPGVGHRELLAQLEGRVLAVDLALWACQATGAESGQVFLRGRHIVGAEGAAVKLCMERATNLLRYGAIPIGVVEGSTPAAKAGALRLRQGKGSRGAADARGGRTIGSASLRLRASPAPWQRPWRQRESRWPRLQANLKHFVLRLSKLEWPMLWSQTILTL